VSDANTALEEKWAQEEASKAPLEKAYEKIGKKKSDEEKLNPEKLSSDLLSQLPSPTGWRILILPYRGKTRTEGGIYLTEQTIDRQQLSTVLGYVLKTGPLAYQDGDKFPTGPWCEEGDWVLFGRYAGSRFDIEGGEVKILNDDEIIAKVEDPEAILHNY
jgi:co-chaperonin GroES (HSP10)|tara:strand:- start:78 stop:557 length:480 start_codon:yes stop_codon:yes gene_type:complete